MYVQCIQEWLVKIILKIKCLCQLFDNLRWRCVIVYLTLHIYAYVHYEIASFMLFMKVHINSHYIRTNSH